MSWTQSGVPWPLTSTLLSDSGILCFDKVAFPGAGSLRSPGHPDRKVFQIVKLIQETKVFGEYQTIQDLTIRIIFSVCRVRQMGRWTMCKDEKVFIACLNATQARHKACWHSLLLAAQLLPPHCLFHVFAVSKQRIAQKLGVPHLKRKRPWCVTYLELLEYLFWNPTIPASELGFKCCEAIWHERPLKRAHWTKLKK